VTDPVFFKTVVVVERGAYEAQTKRLHGRTQLALQLRRQLDEEHGLLLLALHHLARERGVNDRLHFTQRWLRENRPPPDSGGVPFG